MKKDVILSLLSNALVFDDATLPLYYALKRLGYNCTIKRNAWHEEASNIFIGLCDALHLDLDKLPKDSIVYNFEQLVSGSKGIAPRYLEACRKFQIWEYSLLNVKRFVTEYGITNITHLPLGYTPEMTRIDPDYPKDIDVLFYGSLNERRLSLINQLRAENIRALPFNKVYGLTRDILIARSKIVLNMHYYVPGIVEVVRLGYLWANKKCVVCECNSDSYISSEYANCCLYAPYDKICETVREALKQPNLIQSTGETAFQTFKAHDYAAILEAQIGSAPGSAKKREAPIPTSANIGSGKQFMPAALNIDINPSWRPDIVLDISQKLSFDECFETERFGQVTLQKNMFRRIYLYDVLEHVNDVCQTMTNLLELLKVGGILRINVPYDLSLGAWQDPTHKHAFNENSWLYFTNWHWYIGWREARFDLVDLQLTLSDFGKELEKQGADRTALLRQARAVDSMLVLLKKRSTSFDEKMLYDTQTRSIYRDPMPDWSVAPTIR
ncbi:MAG: hypothetical protein IJU76_05450 [Desulfovibrionaceae bacterium]|nr:hypothetical protein [Desulfovibrionaceae bacterium]